MRSFFALSLGFAAAAAACGGRTQVDDLGDAVDHNQTLTGGAGGASSAQGGNAAAGKGAAPGVGGSATAGTGPVVVGGGGMQPSTMGGGAVGIGAGGSTTVVGGGAGIGASSGSSSTAGKGGTTGKGGSGGTTGTGGTGAGAFGGACNPVTQKSCMPGDKCSAENKGMAPLTSCVKTMGGVGEGMDCKRMGLGHDNCGTGLICTAVGVIDYDAQQQPPHRQCRKFCQSDSDCGATQGCSQFTQDGFGVCVDSCLPFSACDPAPPTVMGSAGNNGGANKTCAAVFQSNDGMNAFVGCHLVGPGDFNSQCQNQKDCGPGYFCGGGGPGGGTCQQLCDGKHACAEMGASCSANQPGELGVCQ